MPTVATDMNALVSVIIPTYNDAAGLVAAIESLMAQTYKNIEIIVVNDGSQDNGETDRVAERYADRIRYISTPNMGVSSARNQGIDEAAGKYIAFLDSDDYYLPEKIEKQVQYMQHTHYALSHTDYVRKNTLTGEESIMNTSRFSGSIYPVIIRSCGIATPTVMIERERLGAIRFLTDFHIAEDTCFWINLAREFEFGHIAEALTVVNIDGDTAAYSEDKAIRGFLNILTFLMEDPQHAANVRDIESLCHDMLMINCIRVGKTTRTWVFTPFLIRISSLFNAIGFACKIVFYKVCGFVLGPYFRWRDARRERNKPIENNQEEAS